MTTSPFLDAAAWRDAACAAAPGLHDERKSDRDYLEPAEEFARRMVRAYGMCQTCPIIDQCRRHSFGLKASERSGVYAGVLWRWNDPKPNALVRMFTYWEEAA